jgi:cysteine sulfinate desulfinase/cysteine desulfurase-like protein
VRSRAYSVLSHTHLLTLLLPNTTGEVMALALHPNGALVATGERCSASSTAAADGVSNKYVG